jgi:hypothetical protein
MGAEEAQWWMIESLFCDSYSCHNVFHETCTHHFPEFIGPTRHLPKLIIYLFSSSALFFKSSLLSGVGKLSACTGPCLVVSFQPIPPNQLGDRTGFALCALACRLPPLEALSASGSSWRGCEEAVLSEDSLATLSVMPDCVSTSSCERKDGK